MLKKETIKSVAKLLKLDPANFEAALTDTNEVDLPVNRSLIVLDQEEFNTLKSNEYNQGKQAGVEMEIKEVKKRLGLDFTGKTIDALISAAKAAGVKEAGLNAPGNEEMRNQIASLQNTVQDYETKLAFANLTAEVSQVIPQSSTEEGPVLGTAEIIQLMQVNGYEFKNESGATVVYKAGQRLADQLSSPLPVKNIVEGFIKEKNLGPRPVDIPGGRGVSDKRPPSKSGTLSELKRQFESQGKSLLGEEFNKAVQQAVKDNPEFDLQH